MELLRAATIVTLVVLCASESATAQRRPPESNSAGIISSCRRGGSGAIYGRMTAKSGAPVRQVSVKRLNDASDCGSWTNAQGWWFIGTLEAGHHAFDIQTGGWCVPERIEVNLRAGDTVRIDRVLLQEPSPLSDPIIPQAPRRDLLDCRVAEQRWRSRLGLADSVPQSWRLPTDRELLLATLGAAPVQELVRSRTWADPVTVEYWRPWSESVERVGGFTFRVRPHPADWDGFFLLVSPAEISLTGSIVYVETSPPYSNSNPRALRIRFRRQGDHFISCVLTRAEVDCPD